MKMNWFHKPSLVCSIALVAVWLVPLTASATNVTVDCSGGTPGAFTSMQAAINSLDVIGLHVITMANQPCTETVHITDRQRLTIVGTGTNSTINGSMQDVITIAGSTSITLNQINVTNGNRGIVIARNSEVTIQGCVTSNNLNAGLRIDTNSTVSFLGASLNNGGLGINVMDSTLTIRNSQITGNGSLGMQIARSRAIIDGSQGANVFSKNNGIGVFAVNGAWVSINAPNLIQNNQGTGLDVEDGASVRLIGGQGTNPATNVIEGNSELGINIPSGQVVMFFANKIRNNGFAADQFGAGIRVDDNAFFATLGPGVEITNNTGPGVDATNGGSLDLTATSISNNSGDGIRLEGNANVAFFPPNTNTLTDNGGRAIRCDNTSVFLGDRTGLGDLDCRFTPFPPAEGRSRHRGMRASEQDGNN